MENIHTVSALRSAIASFREKRKRIAFVPTMGALHDGHVSLIEVARQHAEIVVVSIFVNPTQFGKGEDFEHYPRTLEQDSERLKNVNVDVLYTPTVKEMYPSGFSTLVSVTEGTKILCSAARPGHFDGVATVVSKLLLQVQPDVAVFGEKDYQQLYVIRRMVSDLDIPVDIIGAPIMREPDGLAFSSRNSYLSVAERKLAPQLYAVLTEVSKKIVAAPDAVDEILTWGKGALLERGFSKLDYLALCHSDHLTILRDYTSPARLFVAAYLGSTRLIDNIEVEKHF